MTEDYETLRDDELYAALVKARGDDDARPTGEQGSELNALLIEAGRRWWMEQRAAAAQSRV